MKFTFHNSIPKIEIEKYDSTPATLTKKDIIIPINKTVYIKKGWFHELCMVIGIGTKTFTELDILAEWNTYTEEYLVCNFSWFIPGTDDYFVPEHYIGIELRGDDKKKLLDFLFPLNE